jgi:hypothetical protein
VIPVAPWLTTFLEALDRWQTIIAGLVALLAALIAVGGAEWRARKALRASLASEIRLYVDLLIKTRESLKRLKPSFDGFEYKQRDLRDLAVLHPPTVYPAAAGGTMGLLRRPRAADVVAFYATIERLNFAARAMTNEPTKNVLSYSTLIDLIEEACRTSLPLLAELPFDERDASLRAMIAKWNAAEAGAAMTRPASAKPPSMPLWLACIDRGRRAVTPRRLNTIGLVLGIAGVLIIFRWGPPQPSFDEAVPLALEGPELVHMAEDTRRLTRQYEIMSRVGLGLIGLGFVAQLAAVRRAPA